MLYCGFSPSFSRHKLPRITDRSLKIKATKLSDIILQQLENMILEGTYAPGEKLPPERELAKQFEVSRPSLREAIQKLEAKGLVTRKQGGGTFVKNQLEEGLTDPLFELISKHPESQDAGTGWPARTHI